LTLNMAFLLSCQSSIHSQSLLLAPFWCISLDALILYFLSVASHLAWPCALTLSKPNRTFWPTRALRESCGTSFWQVYRHQEAPVAVREPRLPGPSLLAWEFLWAL
jgi:hypothetical protein